MDQEVFTFVLFTFATIGAILIKLHSGILDGPARWGDWGGGGGVDSMGHG